MKYLFSRTNLFCLFFFLFLFFFLPHVFILKWGSLNIISWDKEEGKIITNLYKGSPKWYPLNKVSPITKASIIVAEDSLFYKHRGIDLQSILSSLKANYKAGYIKRGASTITQQVVRMAFLDRRKTYLRKIREIFGALLLELILTKDEILAWYLNLIYFGGGSLGLEQASLDYFSLSPKNLTLNKSIQLALLLPNPNYYGNQINKKKLSRSGQRRFYFILNELVNNKYINTLQFKKSLATGNFGNPILTKKSSKQ